MTQESREDHEVKLAIFRVQTFATEDLCTLIVNLSSGLIGISLALWSWVISHASPIASKIIIAGIVFLCGAIIHIMWSRYADTRSCYAAMIDNKDKAEHIENNANGLTIMSLIEFALGVLCFIATLVMLSPR